MDPYRPIREELGRISGTLERGMARRSQGETARLGMELGHEAKMTGLGMEKTRLGLTEEKHGKEMELLGLKVGELKKNEEWLNSPTSFSLNLPQFQSVVGPAAMDKVTQLISGDAEIDEATGIVEVPTTNRNLLNNLGLLEKMSQGAKLQTDKDGKVHLVYPTGQTVDTGITAMIKPVPYSQTKEGVEALITGREKVAGLKEKSKVPFREKENYKSLIKRRLAIYKILDSGKEKDEIGMMMDLTPTRRTELENKIRDIDAQISGKPRKTEETTAMSDTQIDEILKKSNLAITPENRAKFRAQN